MKEIKTYLRPEMVDRVVHALRDAGIAHMAITHVRSLGSGVDPDASRISTETGTWYSDKTKLELVCSESDADLLVRLIEANARTGQQGDGVIFVSAVERAVKIRTGVEGREAFQ